MYIVFIYYGEFNMAGNLKNKLDIKEGGLRVVKPPKTKPYSDIDLNNWKLYSHIKTGTLWEFASREKNNGHSYDYHGTFPRLQPSFLNALQKRTMLFSIYSSVPAHPALKRLIWAEDV